MTAAACEQVDWEPALVQRARDGDVRAFERLYRSHAGRVYGLCLRLTRNAANAEDCVQETFISAWRALARFQGQSAFGTWLHRIAVNAVLARRRKERDIVLTDEPAPHDVGEFVLDTPVEAAELEAAIAALPDGARDVLVLCGIYGYSHAESGEMLGIAEGTCKAQLHRARRLLRTRLGLEGAA